MASHKRPTHLPLEQPAPQRFISIRQVVNRTGLSASSVRRQEAVGTFPIRVKVGTNRVAWLESEVDAWIAWRCSNGRVVRA